MPPPHEKPTQLRETGETICRSVSKGVPVAALSGMATRNTGIVGPHEYSR
jgi:hypothetical protein